MRRMVFAPLLVFAFSVSAAFALNLTVDAVSGTASGNPTNSIIDAIAQINAGSDVDNNVTLNENAPHIIPATTVSTIGAGKNIYFAGEPGPDYAIVRLSSGGGYNWTVTQDASHGTSITFTNVGFIPQSGQSYANNGNDGFRFNNGQVIFTDCVFTFNNGSDGLGSIEGDAPYAAANNVGDDWVYSANAELIFHGCSLSGCYDDAILIGAGSRTGPIQLRLDEGTFVGNIGGAGIQVYDANSAVTLDGTDGRVLIANCGMRAGAPDTGVKFFWDAGCSFTMNKADILGCTNASFYDFEGIPSIDITDSRIALGNSGSATPAANFIISDGSNDSAYPQIINITRSTFHDCLGNAPDDKGIWFINSSANDPQPTWNISESILSGAGDTFLMVGNAPSTVTTSQIAVVQNGTHAVGAPGDLGTAGTVETNDPAYLSTTYVTGRGQLNGAYLLPTTASYKTAAGGEFLKGGAPGVENVTFTHQQIAPLPSGLQVTPASDDLINGIVATLISGGFHPANSVPADHEPAFTDGAGLGALTGLLNDFPGEGTPAWSGFWPLASPSDIAEIRVFSGNNGGDGRIYHNYDAYVTFDATPAAGSTWIPLAKSVTPANFGVANTAGDDASLSVIQNDPLNKLAYGVTGLRIDFYAVSNTALRFQDQWNAGNANDADTFVAAFESPLIYEVDVYGTEVFGPPTNVSDWSLF